MSLMPSVKGQVHSFNYSNLFAEEGQFPTYEYSSHSVAKPIMMISLELQWSGSAGTPQIKDERSCVIVCSELSARPKHTGKARMYAAVTHRVAP